MHLAGFGDSSLASQYYGYTVPGRSKVRGQPQFLCEILSRKQQHPLCEPVPEPALIRTGHTLL